MDPEMKDTLQMEKTRQALNRILLFASIAPASGSVAVPAVAQDAPDRYKLKIDGAWWYVDPSGTINVHGGDVDLQKDLNFSSCSSFTGSLDWRFTRRQHLLVSASPSDYSGAGVASRQFVFQGNTITAGAAVNTTLSTISVSPGYEFDFIQRDRGHLGFEVLANLVHVNANLNATGVITKPDRTSSASYSGSGSVFAPLPVIGLIGRYYFGPRVYIDAVGNGM